MNTFESYNFTQEEWEHCIKVLNELKKDPFNNPDNPLLSGLITKVYKTAKKSKNRAQYKVHKVIKGDTIEEVFITPKMEDVNTIKNTTISKNALENKVSLIISVRYIYCSCHEMKI